MSGIGIITNPHSKLNKRNPSRTTLLGYILGAKGQLEVTSSLEDLAAVARSFKEQEISILAINGGDGTICRTLTAFIKEYGGEPMPRVAVLRGGTINVLANNLGIRGSPEQILYRLVEWHSGAQDMPIRRLATMEVEGSYGFLFGDGAAASFLKRYYQHKSSAFGAFLWVMRVWGSRFVGGSLYDEVINDAWRTLTPHDQAPISHRSCAVFCSTLRKLPLGYPLFTNMVEGSRGFQCVSFTFAARDAAWALPRTLFLSPGATDRGKMTFVCEELTLKAEAPFDYTLDGELYVSQSSSLKIKAGPSLEFVTI